MQLEIGWAGLPAAQRRMLRSCQAITTFEK